jgi:hypothetical protein
MARNDGAPAACTSAMIGAISAALAAAIAATASLPRRRAARVSFAFLRYPPSFTLRRTLPAAAWLTPALDLHRGQQQLILLHNFRRGRAASISGKRMGSLAAVLASFGRLICCGAPCRMSLRKIAAELAARGHLTAYGKPYVASAVQSMLG